LNWKKASPVYVLDLAFSTALTITIIWHINRYWLTEPWIPFSMLWLMALTIFVGVVAVRYRERLVTGLANRWLLFRGPKASFAERILIIGAGNLGEMTLWLLTRSAYASIFGVVGFVDDDARKRGSQIMGLNVIGSTQEIPALVEKYKIGLIFFAIANGPEAQRQAILAMCDSTPAKTVIIPDLVKVLERSIKKIEVVD
jgi:FlaA1/EpsC-like NDP-sugar epimerase